MRGKKAQGPENNRLVRPRVMSLDPRKIKKGRMEVEKSEFWESLYRDQPVETMPWYAKALDHDVVRELKRLKLKNAAVLDLGTGPGTQAVALARCGFQVTATDISESAIRKAKLLPGAKRLGICFLRDDILQTRLTGPFDLILDRGCFHVLAPAKRKRYVRNILKILKPGGSLVLKCFSKKEPYKDGPHRFNAAEIRKIFGSKLLVRRIRDSLFKGVRRPRPLALLCVLEKPVICCS